MLNAIFLLLLGGLIGYAFACIGVIATLQKNNDKRGSDFF